MPRGSLSHFDFIRVYNDNSRIWLCTAPHWTEYVHEREYAKVTQFTTQEKPIMSGVYTWDYLGNALLTKKEKELFNSKLSDARNSFNIDNGFTLIELHAEYKEFYSFGINHLKKAIYQYYDNKERFINFIFYFKQEAQRLIQDSAQHRVILPWEQAKLDFNDRAMNHQNKSNNLFNVSKYYLAGKYRHVYLTRQQFKCVFKLSEGMRIKSIAILLGISPRTVEDHINKVKEKLQCTTTADLIIEFRQNIPNFY